MYDSLIRIDGIILYGFIGQKRLISFSSILDQSNQCDTKGYIIVNRESSPALYASTHLTDLLSYCYSRIVDLGSKRAKNTTKIFNFNTIDMRGRSSHNIRRFYCIKMCSY